MGQKSSKIVDCIVPFFNENPRVVSVVESLVKSPGIGRIICVDDGSTDGIIRWPEDAKLIHVRHARNAGKAAAIRSGLTYVRSPYVWLMDADLTGITSGTLERVIRHVHTTRMDMLVGRCQQTLLTTKLLGLDIIFSGVRIIRTEMLRALLKDPEIHGYQLEPAINTYMMHMRIAYTDVPFVQYRKKDKYGLVKGLWLDLLATRQVVDYRGFMELARQISIFLPKHVRIE